MWFWRKKVDPVGSLKRRMREEQDKTDEAYERLKDAMRSSEQLQQIIDKAVGK